MQRFWNNNAPFVRGIGGSIEGYWYGSNIGRHGQTVTNRGYKLAGSVPPRNLSIPVVR